MCPGPWKISSFRFPGLITPAGQILCLLFAFSLFITSDFSFHFPTKIAKCIEPKITPEHQLEFWVTFTLPNPSFLLHFELKDGENAHYSWSSHPKWPFGGWIQTKRVLLPEELHRGNARHKSNWNIYSPECVGTVPPALFVIHFRRCFSW